MNSSAAQLTRAMRRAMARAKAAEALLIWYETTHGSEFGHDHHCPRQRLTTGGECTCGWDAFEEAYKATL